VKSSRHLLVDGANVLHAWPELSPLLRRNRDAARTRLIEQLTVLRHEGDGWRITVVFDGRGEELVVERPSGDASFSVIFTPRSATADDVIEQLVASGREPQACLVATADRAERETVTAAGAQVISPDDLKTWIRQAEGRLGTELRSRRTRNDRQWRAANPAP
jgi:predicted RNA-binding protein with PIN domain